MLQASDSRCSLLSTVQQNSGSRCYWTWLPPGLAVIAGVQRTSQDNPVKWKPSQHVHNESEPADHDRLL